MKTLNAGIICLLCILACTTNYAQTLPVREPDYNKPLLFQQLPNRLDCKIADLQNLLQYEVGQEVNINLADNFNFRGIVTSTAVRDNGKITSVVIRSSNYNGAVLSFSKVIPENEVPYFTGRILSMQHGDSYEIVLENGIYVLNKKGFYDMINE